MRDMLAEQAHWRTAGERGQPTAAYSPQCKGNLLWNLHQKYSSHY